MHKVDRVLLFFFNDTPTTEIYTLSLHDALPISLANFPCRMIHRFPCGLSRSVLPAIPPVMRSEEHTSELQSQSNLVCRLLLEKKNRGRGSFVVSTRASELAAARR